MPRFTQIDRHSLYPVEQWGDTLVVKPRGDAAGFNPTTVHHEMATVTELAQSPGIRHLLLDFSGANYFGSVVLGGLVQLTQTVKNRGGRAAICDASQDMQDILRIMKLDTLWEVFPDQRTALRRMAKIPIQQQLWAKRKAFAFLAAVAVVCLAYVFYPRPNYGKIYYEQVQALWREYEERESLAGEDEWNRFSERSTKKLKPIIDHINRRSKAGMMSPPELFILYVARDYWPKLLKRNSEEGQDARKWTQTFLRYTEASIEGRKVIGSGFDAPAPTADLTRPENLMPAIPTGTPSPAAAPAAASPSPDRP